MNGGFNCTRWAFELTTKNWRPSLQQLMQAVNVIQTEELERLMRFHFFDDFLSSLVGRLFMRKYVSDVSGLPYEHIHFDRDERGKPYWYVNVAENQSALQKNPDQVSFNVSHQGDMVILAGIATNEQENTETMTNFGIGADVMKIEYTGGKPLNEFFRIMHRKFSRTEWQYIMNGCEEQQLKSFMRHWCLKEAYVKELGVGITIDLQKISFTVDSVSDLNAAKPLSNANLCVDDVQMSDWQFEEHLLRPNYCAALAFKNCKPKRTESFEFLSFHELIAKANKAYDNSLDEYCKKALSKPSKNVVL